MWSSLRNAMLSTKLHEDYMVFQALEMTTRYHKPNDLSLESLKQQVIGKESHIEPKVKQLVVLYELHATWKRLNDM